MQGLETQAFGGVSPLFPARKKDPWAEDKKVGNNIGTAMLECLSMDLSPNITRK
jgi:hypothetical protein